MRSELVEGSNCINICTVRKFTTGLAKYMEENGTEAKKGGVVIVYDSHYGSKEFTLEAAKTLGSTALKTMYSKNCAQHYNYHLACVIFVLMLTL